MNVKIWLDDIRRPPDEGWLWCRSVDEAISAIVFFEDELICYPSRLEVISLDHDLGDYAPFGGDGIKLMDWLAERNTLYPVRFHTRNPVGMENMQRMYRRYWLGMSL